MYLWNMAERPQNYNKTLYNSIAKIIIDAKSAVYRNTNSIVLQMYWEIGKLIIEEEQNGQRRAQYGKSILKNLANQLTLEFGKGFNERNLNNMRAFFSSFPIWNAVRTELSWTHYRIISRIENPEHRLQYMLHSIEGNWNTRTLQRNIDSQYLGRLLKFPESDSRETSHFIKDPYIFEFLGLPSDQSQTETQIESALISHLQQFLMELGKGFAFVARQQHIVTDTSDFFIDLVFYNYYLKCFILVDLKTHKLTHEAIGQMDMYVRMYNDLKKNADDNPTIGIILCTEKDETVVKYSVLSENKKLFASKYRTYLPDENELKQLIEADRIKFELDN
ncbi:PDDEXK nuclease domain-containing protein [Chryseobacterium sp. SL1]|uniref:PDDEXK nuclease domain-containing protein n=1 Tax=Chryseobacterium sp. SL1 TaxID=2995159 RepID=UPI0022765A6F|nr:PDDEXK nuclease domain-containing protein [Chryseobacterium sp. SL1]MCY1661064.1 PDDEXK nuclease domain-containing protein [Chryseobacterium sp. SL1]